MFRGGSVATGAKRRARSLAASDPVRDFSRDGPRRRLEQHVRSLDDPERDSPDAAKIPLRPPERDEAIIAPVDSEEGPL